MANGLSYTITVQVAFPQRQCVAFIGDGGFSMLMAEFTTAVKFSLPIKVFIIKNNTLGQIKWEGFHARTTAAGKGMHNLWPPI